MKQPVSWTLDPETRTEAVLRWCLEHHGVDRLLVAARLKRESPDHSLLTPAVGQAITDLLGSIILERHYTTAWPGTRLVGHDGLVLTIHFSERLIGPMAAAGELLRHWRHSHTPPLPEDLCLYRHGDKHPVLVSVTHEAMAWLITNTAVDLPGARPEDHDPTDFVPPAEDGFVGPSVETAT